MARAITQSQVATAILAYLAFLVALTIVVGWYRGETLEMTRFIIVHDLSTVLGLWLILWSRP